jgi:hypothetical protein
MSPFKLLTFTRREMEANPEKFWALPRFFTAWASTGLSVRARKVIRRAVANTPPNELLAWTADEWMSCKNCGAATAREILKWAHPSDAGNCDDIEASLSCFL